jgi:hypothetical protein
MTQAILKSALHMILVIHILSTQTPDLLSRHLEASPRGKLPQLKYSYPNWKKPLYTDRKYISREVSPKLSQHEMQVKLFDADNHSKIVKIVSRGKEEKGLVCGINSVYKELSFAKGFDHLDMEHNQRVVYSKLHSKLKMLVYINDQIHVRIMDHIICLRLKYTLNPKGGCYQRFAYKNFSPKNIKNFEEIKSQILVVTNNEVLTNYYLLLYIDKKVRIISRQC